MASIYTVWTTKGKAMAAEQLGPNNPITFTRVAASSKDYSSTGPTALAALTKLDSEQQKGYIAYSNVINSNTLHMELLFKNADATQNYNLYAVGLYATGSDRQEYLYSVTVLHDPQVVNTDSAGSTFGLSLNTVVGDATTVNVTITDAGAVTQAILDAGLSTKQNLIGYTPADDSKVVHTTGDETVDGKKAFKVDPVDGAGNAYAKTVDVNQQLDKKVNVSDMRKPASDVAGIEEVNAKQDKIGYTPADDSKVVHDNHDNTITANNLIYDLSKTGLTPLSYWFSGSFNDLPLGTILADASKMTDGPNSINAFTTTTFDSSQWGGRKAQIAITDNASLMYFRAGGVFDRGMVWNNWTLLSDDSKVAHLSGANNFDTVPTVNNNPLLLASSLPPDLARLSHDANFTAKLQQNGQDVALANNTIARNPNTGTVSETNTFTAAQTFSIAPVINDASTSKGDNQAATMADLKSVENSAWRQLNSSLITIEGGVSNSDKLCLYRIDSVNKRIYISLTIIAPHGSHYYIKLDFSNIVSRFTSKGPGHMMFNEYDADKQYSTVEFNIEGGNISINADTNASVLSSGYQNDCWFGYDTLLI